MGRRNRRFGDDLLRGMVGGMKMAQQYKQASAEYAKNQAASAKPQRVEIDPAQSLNTINQGAIPPAQAQVSGDAAEVTPIEAPAVESSPLPELAPAPAATTYADEWASAPESPSTLPAAPTPEPIQPPAAAPLAQGG